MTIKIEWEYQFSSPNGLFPYNPEKPDIQKHLCIVCGRGCSLYQENDEGTQHCNRTWDDGTGSPMSRCLGPGTYKLVPMDGDE